ncbi:transcriptional adapter 2-alpha isoform X1 [Dendroctonus ponderosae]|uniref:Transcriptional adapter n=1 Tax=Dendroctonus ponderosae TaxID=77166 RepID=A0AAR5PR66_DENPD|nr:transcriptional adapter 2-alpha isoform X1 [Dendroctonus ponderosae]
MANTNTDLTEEDAADLQFPKDSRPQLPTTIATVSNKSVVLGCCSNCFNELVLRYIVCEKCKINICLDCFANGAEFGNHQNDHEYRIFSTNFLLFENSDWTAEEELKLLESLLFYGNWRLVASDFPNRTIEEIKEHYEYFYLDGNANKNLPVCKKELVIPEVAIPYRFQLTDSEEPPRYACNTIGYQSLAGYNAPRGDFENEYDKNAEDLPASLEPIDPEDPYYDILTNLQYAITQSYNNRLRERQRRKEVIAKHGLLLLRKTIAWLHRYDQTITKPVYEKFMRFMHLCEPTKFEMLMEGMHRTGELKIHIQRLISLRKKGITTLAEGRMYLHLEQIRQEHKKQLKVFRSKPHYNWRSIKASSGVAEIPKWSRKKSFVTPLDIIGLPGYDKLSEKEKEMCSNVRLVPESYVGLRDILIAENTKSGHVKLQRARSLLKIDVNKTRKLYDFLVSEGYINK